MHLNKNMNIKYNPRERRNYSLTVGKEYEVIEKTDTRYRILNDKGLLANYSTDLFEEPVEIKVEEEKVITDEQIVEDFLVDGELIFEGNRVSINLSFESCESFISCGVGESWGLNDSYEMVVDKLPERLRKKIYKASLKNWLETLGDDYSFVVMSTNISNNEYFESISEILSEIITEKGYELTSVKGINKNSGNEIVIWTVRF